MVCEAHERGLCTRDGRAGAGDSNAVRVIMSGVWARCGLGRLKVLSHAQAVEKGQVLGHWKVDPELKGLRDPEALARLPEPERLGWLALWGEVDALIALLKASVETARPAVDSRIPTAVRGFLDPTG
jgi:hypothetical protein